MILQLLLGPVSFGLKSVVPKLTDNGGNVLARDGEILKKKKCVSLLKNYLSPAHSFARFL